METQTFSGSLNIAPSLNGNHSTSISVPSGSLDSSLNLISRVSLTEAAESGLDINSISGLGSAFIELSFSQYTLNIDGSADISGYSVTGLSNQIEINITYDDGGDSSIFQVCKYYDTTTSTLIETGVTTVSVDKINKIVTCRTTHCTSFGVQN